MQSIESERYVLRPPELSDFPVFRQFFSDPDASHFYGGPLREDLAWRVLAAQIGHWHLRGYGLWMILPKEKDTPLGGCGFTWPQGWPRRELTWWLLPEARGQGVAVEASKTAIRHAYEVYGWPLVETHMVDANLAAQGLVRKLGGEPIAREYFPDGKTRTVYGFKRP